MVPPVAKAARNRKTKKTMNHGVNAAAVPEITCNMTAQIMGFLRPNLSDKYPKSMFPKRIPSIVTV
jgi:hypothetical protein